MAKRPEVIAHNVALLFIFLLPTLVLPGFLVPQQYRSVVLLAGLALIPFLFWLYSVYKTKEVLYAKSYVLLSAVLLPVVYLISALLSGDITKGLFGFAVENSTFLLMALFVMLFLSSAFLFAKISSVVKIFIALSASFSVFGVIEIIRVVFGANTILPSIFSPNVTNVTLGSWNDIAVFAGLAMIISMVNFVFKPLNKILNILSYINFILGLALLIVVNVTIIWVFMAIISTVMTVYYSAAKSAETPTEFSQKNLRAIIAPSITLIVSLIFIFAGNYISMQVASLTNIHYVDVRPSWGGTIDIIKNVYSNDMIFGSGPNTFQYDWLKFKPVGVNSTYFWNSLFGAGIGIIPTAFAITGLVGGLLWIVFVVSLLVLAFKLLWARMPNDAIRFVSLTTVFITMYFVLLLILYVPQTVILAFAFMFAGILLSVARNLNVVQTIKISGQSNSTTNFVLTIGIVIAISISAIFTFVIADKLYVTNQINMAVKSIQENKVTNAKEYIQKAIKFNFLGKDERPYFLLTQISMRKINDLLKEKEQGTETFKKNVKTAIENLVLNAKKMVEANPKNYANYVGLGDIYGQLIQLGTQGAYDASISAYKQALALSPKDPSIPLAMARSAFLAGKIDEAKKYANLSLKLKPNYTDAYYLLSQIAIKSKKLDEAIKNTESAVLLSPNNTGLLFQLGVLLYSNKDYKKSAQVLARAININPKYANALYYFGLSALKLGDQKTALKAFEEIAKLNPDNKHIKEIINSIKKGETKNVKEKGSDTEKPVKEAGEK